MARALTSRRNVATTTVHLLLTTRAIRAAAILRRGLTTRRRSEITVNRHRDRILRRGPFRHRAAIIPRQVRQATAIPRRAADTLAGVAAAAAAVAATQRQATVLVVEVPIIVAAAELLTVATK